LILARYFAGRVCNTYLTGKGSGNSGHFKII